MSKELRIADTCTTYGIGEDVVPVPMSNKTPPTEAKMVPREPVEAMLCAAASMKHIGGSLFRTLWQAMYDAAPDQVDGSREGRFECSANGHTIYDTDFTNDGSLAVTGDFASDEDRIAYAQRITDKLNALPSARKESDAVEQGLEALLQKYGRHTEQCRSPMGDCDCGWEELRSVGLITRAMSSEGEKGMSKNDQTAARKDAPEQAVAWMDWNEDGVAFVSGSQKPKTRAGENWQPLYAHPPRLDAQTVEKNEP